MQLENVEDIYPLSPVQHGMLLHCLDAPVAGVYVGQFASTITGPLQADLFRQAWQHLLERHSILRTLFVWELDEPMQIVRQRVEIPWQERDWRDRPVSQQERDLEAFLQQDRQAGFDLNRAPLLRVALIRQADARYTLIWTCHHLLSDGWSNPILLGELYRIYAALCRGNRPDDELAPALPYRDYIAWLQQQDWTAARQHWQQLLDGFTTPTPLPLERRNPSTNPHYGQRSRALAPECFTALQDFARRQRVTANTAIAAAWSLLLSRHSGNTDVVFGMTVAGRSIALPAIESRVGLFINTLPVRASVDDTTELGPWLQDLQQQTLNALQYEATPLADIQKYGSLPAGTGLFGSLVVFENQPAAPTLPDVNLEIGPLHGQDQSHYPLVLMVVPTDMSVELRLLFDGQRLASESADRLLAQVDTLLSEFVAHSKTPLAEISLLSPAERSQILQDWNQTQIPLPEAECIHDRIVAQAQQTPRATAVVCGQQRLTYRELDARSNRLARYLQGMGVGADTRVGICLARSVEFVVAILAVLKAGGAYVPLDPNYPRDRLTYILEDAGVAVLLTHSSLRLDLPKIPGRVLCLDADTAAIATAPKTTVLSRACPESAAYIIYTSGSTGQPKGVVVRHRNLLHSILARFDYYPEPVERFLLLSPFAFDSSVAGIFWTLCQGGTLVVSVPRLEQDLNRLTRTIARQRITHTLWLPSLYGLVLAESSSQRLQSLRAIIVAGEACPRSLARQHYTQLPQTKLYNEYGPTEATVWCSVWEVSPTATEAIVPIGQPIANTQLYILDARLQPVPVGIVGELHVGGAGVAAGYLNRPERTAASFLPDPFSSDPDGRLYRTGDLARWREDGSIEWLGRRDRQVKIRGHRVELAAVEAALHAHPDIEGAVAIVRATNANAPSEDPDDIDALLEELLALDPAQAEALLAAIEAQSQPVNSR